MSIFYSVAVTMLMCDEDDFSVSTNLHKECENKVVSWKKWNPI